MTLYTDHLIMYTDVVTMFKRLAFLLLSSILLSGCVLNGDGNDDSQNLEIYMVLGDLMETLLRVFFTSPKITMSFLITMSLMIAIQQEKITLLIQMAAA